MASAAYQKEENVKDNFSEMTDEELVELCQKNNALAQEFLLSKYKNLVQAKGRAYFLIGADRADILQEGMIGLYKAMRDYRSDRQASFRSFADLCIQRQIITAIKTATRLKHIPLNSYISLNKPVYDEESDRTVVDIYASNRPQTPEEIVINKEEYSRIEAGIVKLLSELELEVLNDYLNGQTYQEIAARMEKQVKSIDNALQRVKRKLEKYLSQEN